jgi:hypothetical protein
MHTFSPSLQLHLHVGNTRLVDQFEWDPNNDDTAPDMFAQTLCADLALGGEYVFPHNVSCTSGDGLEHIMRSRLLDFMIPCTS